MSRSRVPTTSRVVASALGGAPGTPGALAAAKWLLDRGRPPPIAQRWHVQITLGLDAVEPPVDFDETVATRFQLDVYAEEWGVYFCHDGHASWIRVTDIAFVHGRDDYHLLALTPSLSEIGKLLRRIERDCGLAFRRDHAAIETNLPGIEPAVRAWLLTL